MDEVMESRIQKMETTVNTLVDSMTTFNPSITAVEALIEADEELNHGIIMRRLSDSGNSHSNSY
jgi:hypothetical protein